MVANRTQIRRFAGQAVSISRTLGSEPQHLVDTQSDGSRESAGSP
jgi:hypothetical protein